MSSQAEFSSPARSAEVPRPQDEARALRTGAALVDRSSRDRLEISGPDRARFLNGYVTADMKTLSPGEAVLTFFTGAKGGILADAIVLALEDRFWIELSPGRGAAIRAHLERYVLADRVEIHERPDLALFAIEGNEAQRVLMALGMTPPGQPWIHAPAAVAGVDLRIVRHGFPHRPRFGLWPAEAAASALVHAILDSPLGVTRAGGAATEIAAIEDGEPLWGVDFDETSFPQELGWADAVSTTKGCYLGQEVVARIHFRGQVARLLRGLRFEGEGLPEAGAEVRLEGRAAGRIGRSAFSRAVGSPIALALLARRASEPGTRVEVTGAEAATVVALPFLSQGEGVS